MQIIPVMDLSKGDVVHAFQGLRQNYKAIKSQVCATAIPLEIIDDFLNIYNFKCIYIADLDAIEGRGSHSEIISSICETYPDLMVWLDSGIELIEKYVQLNLSNLRLILSSESIQSISALTTTLSNYPNQDFILSLDFKSDQLLGVNDLHTQQQLWPKNIIILNLNNVGANTGFVYPSQLQNDKLNRQFNIFVGGGIRNIKDIEELESQGVQGVLVSTALHSKAITGDDISAFMQSL